MLVLSRKRDESIVVGEEIIVTVVDIQGDKVRLGINAPIDVPVHRMEVYEAIQREHRPSKAAQLERQRSAIEDLERRLAAARAKLQAIASLDG
jgi:carbon storage regulator